MERKDRVKQRRGKERRKGNSEIQAPRTPGPSAHSEARAASSAPSSGILGRPLALAHATLGGGVLSFLLSCLRFWVLCFGNIILCVLSLPVSELESVNDGLPDCFGGGGVD